MKNISCQIQKFKNFLFASVLLTFVLFIGFSSYANAQIIALSDIGVYNIKPKLTDSKLNVNFDIKNNSKKSEKVKYGLYLRDKNHNVLDKIISKNSIDIPGHFTKNVNIQYLFNKIDSKKVSELVVTLSNSENLVLTSNIKKVKFTTGNKTIKKDFNKNSLKNCQTVIKDKNIVNFICNFSNKVEKKEITNKLSAQIFDGNIFGKKEKDELVDNFIIDSKKQNSVSFSFDKIKPGYYEAIIDSPFGKTFSKFYVSGKFVKIYSLDTDKKSYVTGENAKLKINSSAVGEFVYTLGVSDKDNKDCGNITRKDILGIGELEVSIERNCNGAKAYAKVLDNDGKVLTVFGTPGQKVVEKSTFTENVLNFVNTYGNYLLIFSVIILLIGLFFIYKKKITIAIALIILAVFIFGGYFALNKIYAANFQFANMKFTVQFDQTSYKPSDNVGLTINITQPSKDKTISFEKSVDGSSFSQVISETDTSDNTLISLGNFPKGTHTLKLKPVIKSRFNISKFSSSRFGVVSDTLIMNFEVTDGGDVTVHFCAEGETPEIDNCIDPGSCSKNGNKSLDTSAFCQDEQFYQVNMCDCGEYKNIKCPTSPNDLAEGAWVHGTKNCESTCVEDDWTPDTDTYCQGVSFTQTSNKCGTSRTVTGTKTGSECETQENKELQCSNDGINWQDCSGKNASGDNNVFRVIVGREFMIKTASNGDKVTSWALTNNDENKPEGVGEVIPSFHKSDSNESIIVNIRTKGTGVYGKSKFYKLNVKAVGVMSDFKAIMLRVINTHPNED